MGRVRELDDSHDLTVDHSGLAAIPAAVAVAEDLGGVTGREIMTAVSLGVDLVARLRLACGTRVGHIAWGAATFSSAAVTGKLLRPDENETQNGLDLAYSQSWTPHPIIDDLGNNSRSPMSASSVISVAGIFTARRRRS